MTVTQLMCVKCFTPHDKTERVIKNKCANGDSYRKLMADLPFATYFTICPNKGCGGIWTLEVKVAI